MSARTENIGHANGSSQLEAEIFSHVREDDEAFELHDGMNEHPWVVEGFPEQLSVSTSIPLPNGFAVRQVKRGVTVVIPTLNEGQNIGWTLENLPEAVDEVVLVDGRSTDDTVEVARRVRPDIVVVEEPRLGKGVALRSGFAAATGDYIVMIDADGSMHPGEILFYLAFLDAGFDFVKGSRFIVSGGSRDMTLLRRLGHRPLVTLVNLSFRVPFTDLCYGFCAFRRDRLDELALESTGFEIETELILRAVKSGLKIAEVPSVELPRRFGESHLRTFRDGARVLRTVIKERLPHGWGRLPVTTMAAAVIASAVNSSATSARGSDALPVLEGDSPPHRR